LRNLHENEVKWKKKSDPEEKIEREDPI